MANEEVARSGGLMKWLLIALVFVAAFIVLKFVVGLAFAMLKWAVIAVAALGVTWVVAKKLVRKE